MTSEKSSLNPSGFTYREMLKRFIGLPIPLTLLGLFIYGEVIPAYFRYRNALSAGNHELAESIKGAVRFTFLSGADESIFSLGYSIILIGAGLLLALFSFGFMMFRPTVNTQYSLGISRRGQFTSRYLAAFTVIAMSVITPFLIIAVFNAVFYGSSKEMWTSFAFLCISNISVFLYSFTIFSFVMMMSGSVIESVIIGSVFLLSPAFISRALYSLISVMAYGSPLANSSLLNNNINYLDIYGDRVSGAGERLFKFTEYLFPATAAGDSLWVMKGEEYIYPPFAKSAVFFAVIILIAAAAMLLHSRRKAEKAGFMGTCPAAEGFCVVVVGTWMASLVSETLRSSEFSRGAVKVITAIAGIVIMAAGYTAADLFFTRSVKAFRRRLWHLPLEICVFLCVIFVTGVIINGAFANIPEKSDIKSVSVSLPTPVQDYRYTLDSAVAAGYMPADSIIAEQSSDRVVFEGFESDEDIENLLELNGMIKDSAPGERGPYSIRFCYTLKNGKQKERIYTDAGAAALGKMTELMRGEVYLRESVKMLENNRGGKYGPLLISPNLSSMTVPAGLFNDEDRNDEFFECIKEDILSGAIPLDYSTEDEILGYVAYTSQNPVPVTDEELMNGYDEESGARQYLTEDCDYIKYFENNVFLSEMTVLPVTRRAVKTLGFLESGGLMKYFENREDFARITYCRFKETDRALLDDTSTGQLSARLVDKDYKFESYFADGTSEVMSSDMPSYATEITDKAELEETGRKIRAVAYGTDDGYYVKAEYESGNYIVAYIPASEIK